MPRRLLVLGAGPAQLGLLRAARAQGLFVVACDRDPLAPGFAYADRRALVSTEDEEGVDRLARALEVDGIVSPGGDWPVAIASRVAQRLGLPHPTSPEVAATTVSKTRQRERLDAAAVPVPEHHRATSLDEAVLAARELGFPCVVKAPDRQGQRGLSLVDGPDELPGAVAAALAASRNGACLVEHHVAGPELTVNAVVLDGTVRPLTVTDRETARPPAFGVALAHVWPAEPPGRSDADVEAAVHAASRAVEALGIEHGPTYTQVVLGADGPRVIEVAARLGGGHDAELCQAALGVDLNGIAIAAALGNPVELDEPTGAGGACVRFLVPPTGVLAGVDGLERAAALPGVLEARVYREPGFRFGPLRTGSDRAGFVLAVGDSRTQALDVGATAAAAIRLSVVDE